MPTITYRGAEYSEAAARILARRATMDAARKPAPVRYRVLLDPTPNATLAALSRPAATLPLTPRPPEFFTTARREASIASNRALNERNRARYARSA